MVGCCCNKSLLIKLLLKNFTSNELEKAISNFNKNWILGQGGQGTIYKGKLNDGRIVATKKYKIIYENQSEHFINEIVILSQINHKNLVGILGCCLHTEVTLWVYEFISNGTVFQFIPVQNTEFPLSWEMCSWIASKVLGALFYLHSVTGNSTVVNLNTSWFGLFEGLPPEILN